MPRSGSVRHRDTIEEIVNAHYLAWQQEKATPVGPLLDAMYDRWRALADGERLMLEWPVRRLPGQPL